MPAILQIDLGPGRTRRVVGIDLGTTNSLVAYVDGDNPPRVIDEGGASIVPSVVTMLPGGRIVVGAEAKRHLLTDTERTVYSVKRLMGKSYQDVESDTHLLSYRLAPRREGLVRVEIAGREHTPIELSAMILNELKERSERHFGERVSAAVITVPAYFNDAQRQATKDAGKLAGLDVLRIINEPTAAALAYGLDRTRTGIVAVYDLGGGTFDVSILRLEGGVFQVLSTRGDTYLGGDDVDQALMGRFTAELGDQHGITSLEPTELQQVRDAAESVKKELSICDEAMIDIELTGKRIRYKRTMTRSELEELARPVIERTIEPVRAAIRDAGMTPAEVEAVVLVGGMTRMPLVKRTVEQEFGRKPFDDLNPDEVVALGAAVQADILSGNRRDTLLLDVVPLSLGIETVGGVMSVLITRNTAIPAKVKELYTTWVDNQTGININVFQGEREFVKDNRPLASFVLGPLPPLPAGMPKIEVTFTIDADGILQVRAEDLRTGAEQEVQVKPSYGLEEGEIERMLRESIDRAQEDIQGRMLQEARTEAGSLIHATRKVLVKHASLLDPEETSRIESTLEQLHAAVLSSDNKAIRDLTEQLDHVTEPLAQRVMDATVREELVERRIDEM